MRLMWRWLPEGTRRTVVERALVDAGDQTELVQLERMFADLSASCAHTDGDVRTPRRRWSR